MNFAVKVILESKTMNVKENPRLCLNLFDLVLSQMVLFCGDIDSDIVRKLTATCSTILQIVLKNISKFAY